MAGRIINIDNVKVILGDMYDCPCRTGYACNYPDSTTQCKAEGSAKYPKDCPLSEGV